MAKEIVDFPIKNCDFPIFSIVFCMFTMFTSLPEGIDDIWPPAPKMVQVLSCSRWYKCDRPSFGRDWSLPGPAVVVALRARLGASAVCFLQSYKHVPTWYKHVPKLSVASVQTQKRPTYCDYHHHHHHHHHLKCSNFIQFLWLSVVTSSWYPSGHTMSQPGYAGI